MRMHLPAEVFSTGLDNVIPDLFMGRVISWPKDDLAYLLESIGDGSGEPPVMLCASALDFGPRAIQCHYEPSIFQYSSDGLGSPIWIVRQGTSVVAGRH